MPMTLFSLTSFSAIAAWSVAVHVGPSSLPSDHNIELLFTTEVSFVIAVIKLLTSPINTPFVIVETAVLSLQTSMPRSLPVPCSVVSILPLGSYRYPVFLPLNSSISSPSIFLFYVTKKQQLGFLISICDCTTPITDKHRDSATKKKAKRVNLLFSLKPKKNLNRSFPQQP